MKVLNLDGLTHYNTNLLDRVENMIDDSIGDCINTVSVNESSIIFSKKNGTSENIELPIGDADTVDGNHAWQMQTLDASGNTHGSDSWLMQIQHNIDGDGYFKISCGDGSVGTKVDMAHASNYASNAIDSDTVDGCHANTFQKHYDGYISDFDTTLTDGEYSFGSSEVLNGSPENAGIYGKLIVKVNDGGTHDNAHNWIWQFAYCTNGNNYWRNKVNNGNWSGWQRMNDNGNANTANTANTATTAIKSNALASTGFGDTNFTYYQGDGEFDGRSGWAHYLIANHGAGETYYHYTIGLPFWDSPIYKRKWDGGDSGWHKFHTTETVTYGTWELTPGSSGLTTGNIYLQYE